MKYGLKALFPAYAASSATPSARSLSGIQTDSVHLRELGTDRWVYWAIDWVRGFIRLLVEADPASPSTEFVHFDHMSEGRVNW